METEEEEGGARGARGGGGRSPRRSAGVWEAVELGRAVVETRGVGAGRRGAVRASERLVCGRSARGDCAEERQERVRRRRVCAARRWTAWK